MLSTPGEKEVQAVTYASSTSTSLFYRVYSPAKLYSLVDDSFKSLSVERLQ